MYQTGTASGYQDLLTKLNTFLTSTGSAFGVKRSGAGTGRLAGLSGGVNSVAETFTLVATSSSTFNVTGSVSGFLGTATVGAAFATDKLAFTLQAGSTAFAAGDTFTLSTAPKWLALRASAGSEYIWKAPGANGGSAIYVGAKTYANAGSDIYNWQLQGFTGFDLNAAFASQPGALQSTQGIALWQGSIPYWFVANGRRVIVVAKVSSVYQAAYLGLIEQYIDPLVYPYALAVGGSVSGNLRYSDSSNANRCFPLAGTTDATSQLKLRLPTGAWRGLISHSDSGLYAGADGAIWPYQSGMANLKPGLDGSAPLLPVTLFDNTPKQIYGRLDGVYATTGFGTGAESIVDEGPVSHLVVQNVSRTATDQFFTVKLD